MTVALVSHPASSRRTSCGPRVAVYVYARRGSGRRDSRVRGSQLDGFARASQSSTSTILRNRCEYDACVTRWEVRGVQDSRLRTLRKRCLPMANRSRSFPQTDCLLWGPMLGASNGAIPDGNVSAATRTPAGSPERCASGWSTRTSRQPSQRSADDRQRPFQPKHSGNPARPLRRQGAVEEHQATPRQQESRA